MELTTAKTYNIKDLYVEENVNEKYDIIFEHNGNELYHAILHENSELDQMNVKIKDKDSLIPFKKYMKSKGLDILLYDSYANETRILRKSALNYCQELISTSKNKGEFVCERMLLKSDKIAGIVCDLLGLNVLIKQNSDINESLLGKNVLLSFDKLIDFREYLKQYIYVTIIELLRNKSNAMKIVNVKEGMDYKILRSLRRTNIEISDKIRNNVFEMTYTLTNIKIVKNGVEYNIPIEEEPVKSKNITKRVDKHLFY